MEEKLTTMVVNKTRHDLVMKVGSNRNCFVPLAVVEKEGQHDIELDVNWTYREFQLQPNDVEGKQRIVISSDDCCDYQRITIKESDGKFDEDRIPRKQFNAEEQTAARQGILSWLKTWLKSGFFITVQFHSL